MKKPGEHSKRQSEALKLLCDPRFLFRIGQSIGKLGVIGECRNGLVLFLAGLTRVFDQPVSILLKGQPSTGKNNLLKAVVALFPPEFVLKRSSLSKKAPAYGKGKLAGKLLYLFQYEGGRDAQLLIRMLQSEGVLEHEYTNVTARATAVIRRKGTPVILTTTTSERVYPDDETRFLSIRADESEALTRDVVRSILTGNHGRRALSLSVVHEAVRMLSRDVAHFVHPHWLAALADHIPADEPRARRDVLRFLSLLKAVALCKSFSDGRRAGHKPMEITPADYCVAWEILHEAFASTYRQAHPRALTVSKATQSLYSDNEQPVSVKELANQLGWKPPLVYKWVKLACSEDLIRYEDQTQPRNLKRLLPGPVPCSDFLPHPNIIYEVSEDVSEISYIDPLTGNKAVRRRRTRWAGDAE